MLNVFGAPFGSYGVSTVGDALLQPSEQLADVGLAKHLWFAKNTCVVLTNEL